MNDISSKTNNFGTLTDDEINSISGSYAGDGICEPDLIQYYYGWHLFYVQQADFFTAAYYWELYQLELMDCA